VSTITDPINRQVAITYDAAGKPLDTTLFNVAIVKQRYDTLGRQVSLLNHKVAGDVTVADYTVGGYDLKGRITSVTQTDGVHPAPSAYTIRHSGPSRRGGSSPHEWH
jgi:YD repeat-containing protein